MWTFTIVSKLSLMQATTVRGLPLAFTEQILFSRSSGIWLGDFWISFYWNKPLLDKSLRWNRPNSERYKNELPFSYWLWLSSTTVTRLFFLNKWGTLLKTTNKTPKRFNMPKAWLEWSYRTWLLSGLLPFFRCTFLEMWAPKRFLLDGHTFHLLW